MDEFVAEQLFFWTRMVYVANTIIIEYGFKENEDVMVAISINCGKDKSVYYRS